MSYIGKTPASAALTSSDITDGIISLPKLTDGTDGNIISYDASGNPVAVATGNDGQVLTSTGAGSPPAFETISTTPEDDSITDAKLATGAFAKITGTGTLAGFTSTGIDDDASANILKLLSTNIVRVVSNKASQLVFNIQNTGDTDPYGMAADFTAAAPDNNSTYFYKGEDNSTARFFVYSDGDVKNHDNSYGAISDERIKQDIRDSNSQWNDIKNIKVRNFKKKDDVRQYGENAWEQIGVVAQELETVSPKLIKHSNPTPSDILSDSSFGTLYQEGDEIPEGKKVGDVKEVHQQVKGVSYSVLYMKSIKALQEAMERIETLEAKVTTLENA
jgi:hypothetical protein